MGPLGYLQHTKAENIYSILRPKMPNRKFISSNRKLVLRNRKLGRISVMVRRRAKRTKIWALLAIYTPYMCPVWLKMPNRKLGRISVTVRRRAKRTKIWALLAIYTPYICPVWPKMPNRKLGYIYSILRPKMPNRKFISSNRKLVS